MNKSLDPRIETWFPKSIYLIDGVCIESLSKYKIEIKKKIKYKQKELKF